MLTKIMPQRLNCFLQISYKFWYFEHKYDDENGLRFVNDLQ